MSPPSERMGSMMTAATGEVDLLPRQYGIHVSSGKVVRRNILQRANRDRRWNMPVEQAKAHVDPSPSPILTLLHHCPGSRL